MQTPLPTKLDYPHRPQGILIQLGDLFLMEMTNWRWSWQSLLITGMITPLLSTLALGVFARDSGQEALAYVLSGNVVVSLMFGNMRSIQSHVVFMRFGGALDYFATLPVRRYLLILAMMLAFLLLSLPSLAVTILVGALALHIPLHLSPLLFLVVPVCAVPLSGIGALIGVRARTPQEAGSIDLVLTLVLSGLGPVLIPPDRLHPLLVALGRFSPATYAASALRQVLLGPLTGQVILDLVVLALLAAAIFWLVASRLDWRQE